MFMEYQQTYKFSKIGKVVVYASNDALEASKFGSVDEKDRPNKITKACIRQLIEYVENKRDSFDLPLSFTGTAFQEEVWNYLLHIPYGKTTTYSKIAKDLGDLKKVRAVGTAIGKNPLLIIVPCHRVLGVDGSLTGYAGGMDNKQKLLELEGNMAKQMTLPL